MSRVRSFDAPHKGLRNVMGKFSLDLGSTDFSDKKQLEKLKELAEDMFTLLNDHVATENEHTLKHLEERAPGASAHDREDHERLEKVQDQLEKQIRDLTGEETDDQMHELYLSFSSFHSQYLEHIYEEETVTEKLLQEHFTDEELMQHRVQVMQKIKPDVLLLWLKYTVPAQRDGEITKMLTAFKTGAARELYDKLKEMLKGELDTDRFERLLS